MHTLLNKIAGRFGQRLVPLETPVPPDMASDKAFMDVYGKCRPFTMTSVERMFSLFQSVRYVVENGLPGDFVECGVWKGGSSMLIALTLSQLGVSDRRLWLYDTFEGMSEPTAEDKDFAGSDAVGQLKASDKEDSHSVWCYSSLDEVKANMGRTGYDTANIRFVQGKVEDSIPGEIPLDIALLRLDTDWYASTYHELTHLYPLLQRRGVLIVDDFGHWEGAKKAVIQYFGEQGLHPILHRIDNTGRILIKD
jgi:O-methyltransferase